MPMSQHTYNKGPRIDMPRGNANEVLRPLTLVPLLKLVIPQCEYTSFQVKSTLKNVLQNKLPISLSYVLYVKS